MPNLLVVEDDLAIATQLLRGLHAAGFSVELHNEGTGAARRAIDGGFDAVVLDLMLPGEHGLDVLGDIHARSPIPVVVLTAGVGLPTRLQAFERGAVDFLPKPFFMEELVARLRARLRVERSAPTRCVRWEDVEVDLDGRVVRVAGEDAGLTAHEFNVLAYLVERPGRAVGRDVLAERTLAPGEERSGRTVDSHVGRVRRKLGAGGDAIHTVWRIGYRFDPAPGGKAR